VCQAGVCVGSSPVVCAPSDACHAAGTCNPATGQCSNPAVADGTSCGVFANGVAACTNGVCALSQCSAGFANCDGSTSNGCEVNLTTDVNNCGTCGRACGAGSACVAGSCIVTNTCVDQVKDGTETDVDCGGGTCGTCAIGKKCNVNTDCTSNACNAATLTCVSSQCADNHKDGTETDVDCGGGSCVTCAVGKACNLDADCASNACDAISHLCVASQCLDHRQDGTETDVDCGGTNACSLCSTGLKCLVNTDCQPGDICLGNVCQGVESSTILPPPFTAARRMR